MSYKPKIMIDSGAYTCWRQGKPVDFDRYCQYIAANKDWIAHYINLDVIMPEDGERAAQESWEALQYMRGLGLDPIAVYHAYEDISWLHRILELGCTYVALAPRALRSPQAIDEWYSLIWPHLLDSSNKPIIRVHALGENREHALCRYPWASADSTAWLDSMQYAKIRFDGISLMHGKARDKSSKSAPDIDTLRGQDLSILETRLQRAGLRRDALEPRSGTQPIVVRGYLAALTARDMEARIRKAHNFRPPVARSLLIAAPHMTNMQMEHEPFHLYLGLPSNPYALPILRHAGVDCGLASYFYISDAHEDQNEKFRGVIRTRHLKTFAQDPDAAMKISTFARSNKILSEVIKYEVDGTEGKAVPVRRNRKQTSSLPDVSGT